MHRPNVRGLQVAMSGTVKEVQAFLPCAAVAPFGVTHGTVWDQGARSAVVWERAIRGHMLCWNGTAWVLAEGHYVARNLLWGAGAGQ